jgi:hypothetical protein
VAGEKTARPADRVSSSAAAYRAAKSTLPEGYAEKVNGLTRIAHSSLVGGPDWIGPPASAYKHAAWRANDATGRHVQAKVSTTADWRTSHLDLAR